MGLRQSKSKRAEDDDSSRPQKKKGSSSSPRGGTSEALRAPRPVEEVPTITKFGGDVHQKYNVDKKVLGEGHYGTVRKCQDKKSKNWYALKTIKKLKVKRIEYLKREIEILMAVDHPNIIKVVDIFEDKYNLHIVTELCTGGELFQRIIEKSKSAEGHYSEHDASTLIRKILSAIEHMHNEHDIVHRDLKPENFLFRTPSADSEPVIIDFGLSRTLLDPADHMATRVGTPYYIAPEVLGRNYDKGCDIWSIGVITYILLCGYPPFYGENDSQIFRSIMKGKFDFPESDWDSISNEAKDFISYLLVKDPTKRPTAAEALNHPWFEMAHAEPVSLTAVVGARLENFVSFHKLKKFALQVIAEHLTEDQIGHIKVVFEQLDTDKTGVLSVDELRGALVDYPDIAEQIEVLLDGVDLDGNRLIDYHEFLAATLSRNIFIREENIRYAFDHFDSDKSGSITFDNLVHIFGSEKHVDECWRELGISDKNAQISYETFKQLMLDKQPNIMRESSLHHSRPSDGGAEDKGSRP